MYKIPNFKITEILIPDIARMFRFSKNICTQINTNTTGN